MLFCQYCNRLCKNLSGLHFHENRCKNNSNYINHLKNKNLKRGKMCYLHKKDAIIKVPLEKIEKYLNEGYKKGIGKTHNKNKISITNGKENKFIHINDN